MYQDQWTELADDDDPRRDRGASRRRRGHGWTVAGFGALAALAVLAHANAAGADVQTFTKDVSLNDQIATLIGLDGITFEDAVDAVAPDELPLRVPGLEDLGPITIPGSTLTIERPDAPLQVGGWTLTFDGRADVDINGATKSLELVIELEWEDADGDITPVVTFELSTDDPFSVGDVQSFTEGLVTDSSSQDSLDDQTALTDVALSFRWDGDSPQTRQWFDVTGRVVVGQQSLSLGFLYSADEGGPKGKYFISAVRLDSTDPGASSIVFDDILPGDWGDIAGSLELSEFVLAQVTGLPAGEHLGRNNLRIGIPTRFFTDCDSCQSQLPEEFELDADLTLLSKFDLTQLGGAVAAAFDYPNADSVVDLYGKVGLSISEVDGGQLDVERVSLRADVPTAGGNDPANWLTIGEWTFRISYDADPLVGGITLSATTSVTVDVDGGSPGDADDFEYVFDPARATFTRTTDGTISVGVSAESNTTWNNAFGLPWVDLTSVGVGFSFTETAGGGAAAFDAALTSTFALCEPGCGSPTIGRLEARLGVTTEARVQFRVSFGENGTSVPIGGVLSAIANQFDAPDLGATLGGLSLDDLALSITLTTSGEVTFETFARADLGAPFGAIDAYFFVGPGTSPAGPPTFFFGARPTGGMTLGSLLGLAAPVVEDIELPSLGIVAVPTGGFEATSAQLSTDGFRFFRGLYGCPDAPDAAACDFEVALEPGVNLLANITFPGALAPLAEALWLDPSTGIQFQGTLSLPGVFDPGGPSGAKLGLRLTLPRVEPGDAVEFIEDGSLTLGIEVASDPSPRIALFVEGELNTRWQRGEPAISDGSCPYTSVPLPQFENPIPGEENPTWCYDRLQFRVRSELSLTPTQVSVSLLGALSAPNGWQQPFGAPGLEWLIIDDLRVKLEVAFNVPGGNLTVNAGFLGAIRIDNPDQAVPDTVLQASFGAGVTIQPIPGPPGVTLTPSFKGVRAYVSRIGMSDVTALQRMIFPTAGPLDLSALPDVEFQNLEFMFAIASDPDLCLEPRIGFAGELWIDPQRTGAGGDVPDGPCRPFGEGVDPAECLDNQDLGCFASVRATIGLDGIFVAGAVAEFELGPISWSDALVDLRLAVGQAPILAVRGGVDIAGLGGGELALKLELLPPRVEFFGSIDAFGAFEAQVSGELALGLGSLFPPSLDAEFQLHAALRADFEREIRSQISDELRTIADKLGQLDEALELLADDPIANLAEARDALQAAGVTLPAWMNGLVDYVEEISENVIPDGEGLPSFGQILDGEFTFDTPAIPDCAFGYIYFDGLCRTVNDEYAPSDFYCITGELDGRQCEQTLPLPSLSGFVSGLPGSWQDALNDIHAMVVQRIKAIDLVPNISGLGINDYLYDLAEQVRDARFLRVDCSAFDWNEGEGAGDISVQLLITVLSQEYGFDVELDLTSPGAGVQTVVSELLELFLETGQQEVDCVGAVPVPDWLQAVNGGSSARPEPPVLSLDPAGPVDEGQQVTVNGAITPATSTPIDITITWGDGASSTLTGVTDGSFSATHTYADDDPTYTGFDLYTVSASSSAAQGPATTTVRVDNVAPQLTVSGPVAGVLRVAEGQTVSLQVAIGDVAPDTHRAVIRWGDGATTNINDVTTESITASHVYRDDNPSGTPFDIIGSGLRITVTDDDGGQTTFTADVRVDNVNPTVQVTGPGVVEEGVPATYQFTVTDPGVPDTHSLRIEWGDGTSQRVTMPASRMLSVAHTYRDDNPTGTPSDAYTIRATVTDDDTGTGTAEVPITVANVAPVVSITGSSTVTTQYSDPIGGNRDTGAIPSIPITAYDVADDTLTITPSFAGEPLPGWLSIGEPTCVANGPVHADCTWLLTPVTDPVSGIHSDIAPGTYVLTVTVTDDDTGSHSADLTITVLPEDARTWYHGPTFAATESATDGDAVLELRATVRDITSAVAATDPQWDPWPGDIRRATMSFDERPVSPPTLCNAAGIDAVFVPFNPFDAASSIGVGTCNWTAVVNGDASEYFVATTIGGYYSRDSSADDTVVTVARPLASFITGGGYLVLTDSAGQFAGATGTHANFGFHVKFTKKLTNLQGGANIIVRAGGRVYQIKSNSTTSLGVSAGVAQFEAKANLTDVTDPNAPVVIGGNYVLQMRMHDNSASGATDTISFALWDIRKTWSGNDATTTQLLLFSSKWTGSLTVEQTLAGGNVMVHHR